MPKYVARISKITYEEIVADNYLEALRIADILEGTYPGSTVLDVRVVTEGE